MKNFVLLLGNWPFSVQLCLLRVRYVSTMDIISDSLFRFRFYLKITIIIYMTCLLSPGNSVDLIFPFLLSQAAEFLKKFFKKLSMYISIYFLLSRALFKISIFSCFALFPINRETWCHGPAICYFDLSIQLIDKIISMETNDTSLHSTDHWKGHLPSSHSLYPLNYQGLWIFISRVFF